MNRGRTAFAVLTPAALVFIAGARASGSENGGGADALPTAAAGGHWESEVRTIVNINAAGYRAAKVISPSGDKRIVGSELDPLQGSFLMRGIVRGRYLHWYFLPYTDVPVSEGNGYHVNIIGLETALYFPARDWLRLGFYHHSSHNVADGAYGFGTDLNALVLDVPLLTAPTTIGPWTAIHGFRPYGRWYLRGNASPWVLTRRTNVAGERSGWIKYRLGIDYSADGENIRTECSGSLLSAAHRVGSMALDCAGLWRPGSSVLGTFGEHVLIGPYVSYRQNLTRLDEFGGNSAVFGLRLDILVAENVLSAPVFW